MYISNNCFVANGTPITEINDYEELDDWVSKAAGKDKLSLPFLCVHGGVRGTYSPTDTFFIDIDTRAFTEFVLAKKDEIFLSIPVIKMIQTSAHGKLHFICKHSSILETEQQWTDQTMIMSVLVLHLFKTLYDIDIFNAINEDSIDPEHPEKAPKPAFDTSNTVFTQGLYLTSNPIYRSSCMFGSLKINNEDANKLKLEYPKYFTGIQSSKAAALEEDEFDITDIYDSNIYKEIAVKEKITIDRNFTLGTFVSKNMGEIELSGNQLRWRICSCLLKIFKDKQKAQAFVNKHFTHTKDYHYWNATAKCNKIVFGWLMNTFFKEKKKENSFFLKDDQYLTDYKDFIIKEFQKHDKLQIVSPTGSGKTRLMIELARELNAVILAPYNATLSLYSDLEVVASFNQNKYDQNKPQALIWDQLERYDISDRIILVDESHQLFLERLWRGQALRMLAKLRSAKKVIMMTATPCGELSCIGGHHTIEFSKNHHKILTSLFTYEKEAQKLLNIETLIEDHLKGISKKWDIIAVMDDNIVKMLYDVFGKTYHNDIIYFRSSTKYNNDCINLLNDEVIHKKLFLGTNISFNGLNFRNTEKKILLITSLDVPQRIIQQGGRFRNVDIHMRIYYNINEPIHNLSDIDFEEQKHLFAIENNNQFCSSRTIENEPDYFNAKRQVWEFENKWNLKNTLATLQRTGYFIIGNTNYLMKFKDVIKPSPSMVISNQLKTGELPIFENLTVSEAQYYKEAIHKLESFCNDFSIESPFSLDISLLNPLGLFDYSHKIDKKRFLSLVNSFDSQTLITTIIDNLREIINIARTDKETFKKNKLQWQNWLKQYEEKPEFDIKLKNEYKKLKHVTKIFNKNYPTDIAALFNCIEIENTNNTVKINEKKKNGGKIGGKIGSPKKKVELLNTITNEKIEFKSKTECMEYLGISSAAFSKLVKGVPFKHRSKLSKYKVIINESIKGEN